VTHEATALLVPFPAAEPLTAPLWPRWKPPREHGIPAHVTLLYPFAPASRVGVGVLAELGALFAGTPAFDVRFDRTGRFPEVVYLEPDPAEPFAALTRELVGRYPAYRPYGGVHDEIVPHLTAIRSPDGDALAAAEGELAAGPPVETRAEEAWLMGRRRDGAWERLARFPFA
jgi:2'-5' RNA ligase